MKVIAIILGAGKGIRVGGRRPKQFLKIKNKTLIERVIEEFKKERRIRKIIVTLPENMLQKFKNSKKVKFIEGGVKRQDSVLNAGEEIKKENFDYVIIHDSSRPFVKVKMLREFLDVLRKEESLIFARPVVDTLKLVRKNKIIKTIPRKNLYQAETPQGFRKDVFFKMLEVLKKKRKEFTDDSQIAESLGVKVKILKTPGLNFKITFKEDLNLLKLFSYLFFTLYTLHLTLYTLHFTPYTLPLTPLL